MHSLIRRAAAVAIPLGMGPGIVLPTIKEHVSSTTLMLWYPVVLMVLEFLVLSRVFRSESVLQSHGASSISWVARMLAASFDASRLGLLVVTTNTGGSLREFQAAVAWSAVLESIARNNVIHKLFTLARYGHALKKLHKYDRSSRSEHAETSAVYVKAASKVVDLKRGLLHVGRFRQISLGGRVDVEYWGPYQLLLMRLSNWGDPLESVALDEAGDLLPALYCSWDMLGACVVGELLGDLLSTLIAGCIGHLFGREHVVRAHAWQPGPSLLLNCAMWLVVGHVYVVGIGGMGVLA